mmetsp:Transcript_768/g.1201  ORF Transcript_768/g.1201 Transcript_768/m.1201 type:complete len:345 (+) Transcript_768:918-1952(+)
MVPKEWAMSRAGGGRFTLSDVLIGRMNDAKFEPWPVRLTMRDLRYQLQSNAPLVVHIRPSVPLLPAGIRAPEFLTRFQNDATTHKLNDREHWQPVDEALKSAEVAIKWQWDLEAAQWIYSVVLVQIDARPFSEGAMRQAFKCRELSDASRCYVAKFSKNSGEPRRSYFEDVRMQTIAASLAKRYNARNPPKTVTYVDAAVLELPYRRDAARRVCGVESMIEGVSADAPFRKYNNNTGWKTESAIRNTPQTFSHFTYEETHQRMIVVDVQGVSLPTGDVYTDPQIHVVGGVGFGGGNHGQTGINGFLETHQCNAICESLGLPSINPLKPVKGSSGTSPKPLLVIN